MPDFDWERPLRDLHELRELTGGPDGSRRLAWSEDWRGAREWLLGKLAETDAPSYVSGLLIGADLRIGLGVVGDGTVALIGDPALTRLYGAALEEAGRTCAEIDGEQAFLAGIRAIAEKLS